MKRVGLVVAVETGALERKYGLPSGKGKSIFDVSLYKTPEYTLYALHSGAGEIFAAAATQHLIDCFGVDLILNYGVVGGLSPEMSVGRTVVVNSVVHYDYDVSAVDGVDRGQYADMTSRYITLDRSLVIRAQYVDRRLDAVVCASGDKFVADAAEKEWLRSEFRAEICDMEAAGIALTCQRNEKPCLLIKTVSDATKDGAAEYWRNKEDASDLCLGVLDKVVRTL